MLKLFTPHRRASKLAALVALGGAAAILTVSTAGASDITGTLGVTGGTLSATFPTELDWSATLNGADQTVYDTTSGHQSYTVSDPTGSGAGWNISASATQFTTGGGSPHTLADGSFTTNGSLTSATATTVPTETDGTGSVAATNSATYPASIPLPTGTPSSVKIYNAAIGSGMGSFTIGNVGWWLSIPLATYAGTYTSTVTLAVNSGP